MEYERAVVSLSQADANLARHLLQIEQAQASLEEAKALLDFTRITAPAGGMIVSVIAQEGQTLNAAQTTPTVLRIGDLRTIRVSAKVSAADMRRLTPGMEAYFTTPADGERRWQANLKEISPIPQGSGGLGGLAQFDARVEIDNADDALLPGMTAQVFFVSAEARCVLKIPLGAVTYVDGPMSAAGQYALQVPLSSDAQAEQARRSGTATLPAGGSVNGSRRGDPSSGAAGRAATVQVVGPKGERQTRNVHIGASNDVEAEVLSGLAEGETVVTGAPQPPMPEFPTFPGG